jgi:acyl carrier protein
VNNTDASEIARSEWLAVLGRPDVSPADNFFELGGNSVLLMELVSRAEERVGAEVNFVQMFVDPRFEVFEGAVANAAERA